MQEVSVDSAARRRKRGETMHEKEDRSWRWPLLCVAVLTIALGTAWWAGTDPGPGPAAPTVEIEADLPDGAVAELAAEDDVRERWSREAIQSVELNQIRLVDENSRPIGDGEVLIQLGDGSASWLPVVGGGFSVPPTASLDDLVYLVKAVCEDGLFCYPELDGTWGDLMARSPLRLAAGEPYPVRAFEPGGAESTAILALGPASSRGLRIDPGVYRGMDFNVVSPLAIPIRSTGTTLELRADGLLARIPSPEPRPSLTRVETFGSINLERLRTVELVFEAQTRLDNVRLSGSWTPESMDHRTLPGEGFGIEFSKSDWIPAVSGFEARYQIDSLVPGDYDLVFLGPQGNSPLILVPNGFTVDAETGAAERFRIDSGDKPPSRLPRTIVLEFAGPVSDLLQAAGQGVSVAVVALEGAQLAAGQPSSHRKLLREAIVGDSMSQRAEIAPPDGLGPGAYEVSLDKLGFVAEVEFGQDELIRHIAVPSFGHLRLRWSSEADGMIGESLPGIRPAGYREPIGQPLVARPLGSNTGAGAERSYLLAYGTYEFVDNSSIGFVSPVTFEISLPEQEVLLNANQGETVAIRWHWNGEAIRLPFKVLQGVSVIDGDAPLERFQVSGLESNFAEGTIGGVVIRAPRSGTFDVLYTLDLPGVGRVERRMEGVEWVAGARTDIVDSLDD